MYTCACGKTYKRKTWFQNHRSICELINDNPNDDDMADDLPSKIEMWNCIKILTKKYEDLERKLKNQQKYINKEKKKMSVIDWLNENTCPEITFNQLKTKIVINENDLQEMFDYGYIQGICTYLEKIYKDDKILNPITGFDQKLNTLFMFNGRWEIMDNDDFTSLINIIASKFRIEFRKWRDNNPKYFENERYEFKGQEYLYKVMGGKYSEEENINKIYRKFYKYIKFNLKEIIKYEFTF